MNTRNLSIGLLGAAACASSALAQTQFISVGLNQTATFTGQFAAVDEQDWFSIQLNRGDVIACVVADVDSTEEVGSVLIPKSGVRISVLEGADTVAASSAPVGRNISNGLIETVDPHDAAVYFTASFTGGHLIRVDWLDTPALPFINSDYTLTIQRSSTGLALAGPAVRQVFFLDFDGATIVPGQFVPGESAQPATLSPLSAFLPNWGLEPADEDAVIDAIVAKIGGDFDRILDGRPFQIELRNSRDHADPGAAANVSRVIIGGSLAEFGTNEVFAGVAQGVDVGNLDFDDDCLVLLDIFADPDPEADDFVQANSVPRAPGFSIVEVIGRGVGNVASHEMGHLLGNFHTDNGNDTLCLMDQGGVNSPTHRRMVFEIGADGVAGTADDEASDFVADDLAGDFGITGAQQTEFQTAIALRTACPPDLNSDGAVDGADQSILLAAWGSSDPASDLNGDGVVNGADLSILLAAWGACE